MTEQQQIQQYLETHEVTKCPTVCATPVRGIRISEWDKYLLNRHQRLQDKIKELKKQLFKQGPFYH